MLSTNNTEHKFGIKYSYIAIAMNDTLKAINSNVKNLDISQTNAVALEWSSGCIVSLVSFAFSLAEIIITSIFVPVFTPFWIIVLASASLHLGFFSVLN